ncbi:MAG: CSLREA domain-containing protein [Actinobacteria bacterium]|nr:CSLREA domain-containing protein [Actinomycetota bacterium]
MWREPFWSCPWERVRPTDIPVATTSDVPADDEACSLREAIQAAQTNS